MHAVLQNHTQDTYVRRKDVTLKSMPNLSKRMILGLYPLCQQSLIQSGAPEVHTPQWAWVNLGGAIAQGRPHHLNPMERILREHERR